MTEKTASETNQNALNVQGYYSSFMGDFGLIQSHPDLIHPIADPSIMRLTRNERLKLAITELRIGSRIHDELKRQGRTVTWLAQQLCMERTGLYYIFRNNSINLELLMRISAIIGYNFMQDVTGIYRKYGL